ncbi:regulatory protein GemA [Inquilinus limosus]|uniref:regulatory protein GemA n=1 Tax=Inquilinus limosus TaxID=171674 RepID=UPI00069211CD|nr:regulatory protein GemA [Inquilinus limosus]
MSRRELLAQIHIAKKQLGLDDGTYRTVLERVAGRASAAELSDGQLVQVIKDFKARGWKPTSKLRFGRTPTGKLIRVLWKAASREKSETSLRSMIRHVLGLADDVIPDPDMLTVNDATRVIEAIKGVQRQKAKRGKSEHA